MKAAVFDLDDTLYDETTYVDSGFKAVSAYASFAFGIDSDDFYEVLTGTLKEHGRGQTFNIALKSLGINDKAYVEEMVNVYRDHEPSITLYPGVKEMLCGLKSRGYMLGLVTDGNARVQKNKVEALGIKGLFDCLVFSDDLGPDRQKPHPLPYVTMLKSLSVASGEAAYIGDNPHKDFVTAKKMGMQTVRVHKGPYKDIVVDDEHDADLHIDSVEEAENVITVLFHRPAEAIR